MDHLFHYVGCPLRAPMACANFGAQQGAQCYRGCRCANLFSSSLSISKSVAPNTTEDRMSNSTVEHGAISKSTLHPSHNPTFGAKLERSQFRTKRSFYSLPEPSLRSTCVPQVSSLSPSWPSCWRERPRENIPKLRPFSLKRHRRRVRLLDFWTTCLLNAVSSSLVRVPRARARDQSRLVARARGQRSLRDLVRLRVLSRVRAKDPGEASPRAPAPRFRQSRPRVRRRVRAAKAAA